MHRGTDGFPATEGERPFGLIGHPFQRKTRVCSGIQRKEFSRAKDGLQGIHEDSQVRAEFPRHCALPWNSVLQKLTNKLTKSDPNGVRLETCWHKNDDDMQACIRAIQGRCSRPTANPEFFKNVIAIPREWTNAICHSSSLQYRDKILLNGLTAGGIGRSEDSEPRPSAMRSESWST